MRRFDEFTEIVTNEFGESDIENFTKTPVGDAHFAFQGKGEHGLVEIIDEFAVVVLRAGDDLNEFLKLLFRNSASESYLCIAEG